MNVREKLRYKFFTIIGLAVSAVLVAYPEVIKPIKPVYNFFNKAKVNLGLDLQGGIHLEYKADTSNLDSSKKTDALQGVQDVIERRINAFGVGEPLIQTAKSGKDDLIIVELPGVKDIEEAKQRIKDTPFLEFKEEGTGNQLIHEIHAAHILIAKNGGLPSADESDQPQLNDEEQKKKAEEILKKSLAGEDFTTLAKENSDDPGSKETGGDLGFVQKGAFVPEFDKVLFEGNLKDGQIYPQLVETQFGWHIIKKIEEKDVPNQAYVSTGLTGKNLKSASVTFQNQGLSEPEVSIKFDAEGTKLFADITKRNLEKTVAIYLDGQPISTPRVQSEITSGDAVITGSFTVDEAKQLAQRLNEGALPIPLILVSQQSVEATLGMESLQKSLKAGIIGLIAVMIFMIIYYRFLGIIASFALIVYTAIMVSIIKLSAYSPWEITLTLSGIAGIILSIGMAVDANILIFERTKEEIRRGRNISSAIEEGFKRAWTSIRDGNLSTIITSIILIFFGTGFVKGFAVTLILGVLVSLFSAIVIVRNILRFIGTHWLEERMWIVMRNKKNKEE
ncbi:MAG: protein translocase subunit SecD [Patescibacteria group bacterium]